MREIKERIKPTPQTREALISQRQDASSAGVYLAIGPVEHKVHSTMSLLKNSVSPCPCLLSSDNGPYSGQTISKTEHSVPE
mmetsp:Transcript_31155/g.46077  ORF Transcript_31155/g.46077 Transcript_31155/m.46077 type:complete len:81 (-) Transcript_31155:1734-1976(-)